QAAMEYCDRALEINPRYPNAYLSKAQAYLGLNNFPATINNCDRALELNRNLLEAYSVRGFAHCYAGDYQNAQFNFYRMSVIKPSATNLYNLAMLEFTQEMYADALKSCDRCLRLDDKFKFAYYARANVYYELKYPELAREDYELATELEDLIEDKSYLQDEHAYYVRGLAKYQIGDDKIGGVKDVERAREIAAEHQYQMLRDKAIALLAEINRDR
ncbi:MAG: hypothetical protein AAFQ41_07880, partial [Cyanobacteria bacterium J06623_7]